MLFFCLNLYQFLYAHLRPSIPISNERWTSIIPREDRRPSPMVDLKFFFIPFFVLNALSDVAYDVGIVIRTVRMVCIAGYIHLFVRASVSASLDDLSSVIAQTSSPARY